MLGLEATDNNALAFAENTLAMFPVKIVSCSKGPSNLGRMCVRIEFHNTANTLVAHSIRGMGCNEIVYTLSNQHKS